MPPRRWFSLSFQPFYYSIIRPDRPVLLKIMKITLIKHQNGYEVITDGATIPIDTPITLYTSDEIAERMGYQPHELLQLQQILEDDEEDWSCVFAELNAKSDS